MRILYANHTGQISGAEQSLLALLAGLPEEVSPAVACPEGPLAESIRELGVPVVTIPGTDASLRLHPRHTSRGLVDIVRMTWGIRRAASRVDARLVHANSIRTGVIALLARWIGGRPVVVHIHDRLPTSRIASLVLRLIARHATAVVGCSRYVTDPLPELEPGRVVRVVYNPVDPQRFYPAANERLEVRQHLGFHSADVVLAVVAQITPWKAQDDAVQMVARLKPRHPGVRLLLVGSTKFVSKSTRYDNRAFARELEALVTSLDLRGEVFFLGERADVAELLRAIDILLVPSWEEPFGMALIEAMATEVPVIATNVGGAGEIITDGRDGLLLPPRQPDRWVTAVEGLVEQPELRRTLGRKARQTVIEELSVPAYVQRIVDVYREADGADMKGTIPRSTSAATRRA